MKNIEVLYDVYVSASFLSLKHIYTMLQTEKKSNMLCADERKLYSFYTCW